MEIEQKLHEILDPFRSALENIRSGGVYLIEAIKIIDKRIDNCHARMDTLSETNDAQSERIDIANKRIRKLEEAIRKLTNLVNQ
jgi:peptidoglycan hydrolase CwlO-like protein